MPFDGMIAGRRLSSGRSTATTTALQRKLGEITQRQFDSRRGFYGTVGDGCVLKNCQILKDVKIGPACYIKGANKLKNLTINSTEDEPTQIGEGVELVNGIIGLGCHVFYGCKAVRFVMGNNSNLKYGARLIHSYLGDNSTVSCCELLNNLIFPAHEQHHNNSFLVASLLLGQSNLAAGATIGSNHNSRANDGEILAGRGFWPGLCTTLKHSCRFASFTLLAKGDYPAELNIPLPFSLLSDDRANDRLLVIPAYWWRYNMYALARNTWKFTTRDKRKTKTQHIEFDCLAPDTVEEIVAALRLLEVWAGKATAAQRTEEADGIDGRHRVGRRRAIHAQPPRPPRPTCEILGENMEASHRPVVILKARQAHAAYREMLHYYAVKNLLAYLHAHPDATRQTMCRDLAAAARTELGQPRRPACPGAGRRAAARRHQGRAVEELAGRFTLATTKCGKITLAASKPMRWPSCWNCWTLTTSRRSCGIPALDEAVRIQEYVRDQVYVTRKKDYDNPFRQAHFPQRRGDEGRLGHRRRQQFRQAGAAGDRNVQAAGGVGQSP